MVRLSLILLAACGRVGFDSTEDAIGSDAPSDSPDGDAIDAAIDAPPNAMTLTFGEAPGTMIMNVTRDTFVSNEAGESGFNYGGEDEVRIERDVDERALLAFDLSAIPATATIISASLATTVVQIPPVPSPINVYRVLEAWEEGVQTGASGFANYGSRTPTQSWTNPGAGPPVSSTMMAVGSYTPMLGRRVLPLPVTVVQQWVALPASNNGLVSMSTNNDSTRFTTSEGTPSADRPVLTVTFVP